MMFYQDEMRVTNEFKEKIMSGKAKMLYVGTKPKAEREEYPKIDVASGWVTIKSIELSEINGITKIVFHDVDGTPVQSYQAVLGASTLTIDDIDRFMVEVSIR